MATTRSRPRTDAPAKSTLFCPSCDYHDRADGDWDVEESARWRRLRCPACETTITTRPRRPGERAVGARPGR